MKAQLTCHLDGACAETKATDVLLAPANTEAELLQSITTTYGIGACHRQSILD